MPETLSIGALIAAVVALFGLLLRVQEQRAKDAIDRAKTAEAGESAARDRVEQTWERTAEMLHETNGKLAAITQALIDQRRSPQNRS